ncbi:hypothetical protein L6452_37423 [Arctium lappa]|uniref:Uncharacterized protein n=1 Tax=Arctium lappa TaxID=4217 RepID=A0ACB8Y3N2_ARCLA|nr:hypothetical protein L6452_37423 [Arctium lappa]
MNMQMFSSHTLLVMVITRVLWDPVYYVSCKLCLRWMMVIFPNSSSYFASEILVFDSDCVFGVDDLV